jgi:quinate dehydrogenase (quinone)
MHSLIRLAALCGMAITAQAQTDWPVYGHDPGAARYSPLKQINTGNVAKLKRAWTFHTGKGGSGTIPVVAGGTMYFTGDNGIFAIDPETGRQIWKYEATQVTKRGLVYWPGDRTTHPRVFAATGSFLIALDTTNGKPVPGFGNEGRLDLKQGVMGEFPDAAMGMQSPPALYGDILITGSNNGENFPSKGAYGDIRAWDARTGKLLWTFHTVPRPGEPGSETWELADSWKNRSGTNAWGFLTVDTARGIVYVPLGSPTSDFYGADRPGNGLYGNSVVALDAKTGKMKWFQQLVHHDLWDYDPAAPPALIDIRRNGKTVPAVAQITKMGILFVFDRETGAPIYGMEERPVPRSAVPGEKSSPTQPFPLKPPPLSKISFRKEDLYDRTPEHAAFCRDLFEKQNLTPGVAYTPMPLEGNALVFPSTLGGGNWGGVSFNPDVNYIFANVMNVGQWGHMEKRVNAKTGEVSYFKTAAFGGAYARFWDPAKYIPCTNPPFGEIVAVNAASGDIAWRTPLGVVEELEAKGVHNTGTVNLGGSIATAGGLVFIAATNDSRFRAFDAKTGKELWVEKIDANGHTSPITYQGKDGKQYVAIMAGGAGFFGAPSSDALVAFALE